MFYLQLIPLLLLLSLGPVSCQSDAGKEVRKIPQWGTGLIAMTVFLFLVLVIYVANTVMKKKSKSNIESDPTEGSKAFEDASVPNGTFGHYRSSEHEHAYDNPIEVHDNVLTTPM
ncbi:PDZK1-interacting protein 1 [Hyla sarda]|uniref:PDZK1-interacting protein 1 n=1 Tax=Hyla sarda TaxID=327740 RepID=UPI0024C42B8A|nr:PDZK1-interacting protein 1 [Hyla sarda]